MNAELEQSQGCRELTLAPSALLGPSTVHTRIPVSGVPVTYTKSERLLAARSEYIRVTTK